MKDYGLFLFYVKFYDNVLKFYVFYNLLIFGLKCNQILGFFVFLSQGLMNGFSFLLWFGYFVNYNGVEYLIFGFIFYWYMEIVEIID